MFWKKCGARVKMVLAVMVIALLAGRWNEGAGSGSLSNFWKQGDQKNEDVGTKSDANRPVQHASSALLEAHDTQINIDIGPGGVVFNGRGMSFGELDRTIEKLAALSTKNAVIIRCTLDSPHRFLIRVLDICHKYKMYNLSIFSM